MNIPEEQSAPGVSVITSTGTGTHPYQQRLWNDSQTNNPTYKPKPRPPSPIAGTHGPIEGLDELAEVLGVGQSTRVSDVILASTTGKHYSLTSILAAQLKIMQQLQILLTHRVLTPELGDSMPSPQSA